MSRHLTLAFPAAAAAKLRSRSATDAGHRGPHDRARPGGRVLRGAAWTRYLGAVALAAVGVDHLRELSAEHYAAVPTIGTLFALNFAASVVIACALVAPVRRLPGRAGRAALPLLGVAGIGVAAGSLGGLVLSETSGLFGFTEVGFRSAILVSIALEVVTVVLLGAHMMFTWPRGAPPGAGPKYAERAALEREVPAAS